MKLETLWYVNNGENALKIHYSHNGIFLGSSLKLSNSWTNANIFFRGKKEEKALLLYKHCLYVCERTISETYLYWIAFLWKKRMNHLEIFSFAWICVKKQLDDLLPPVLNDSRWEKSYRSIRCEHKNKDFFMFRKFKREKKKNGILWWTLRQEAWKRNCKSNGKSWRSKKDHPLLLSHVLFSSTSTPSEFNRGEYSFISLPRQVISYLKW